MEFCWVFGNRFQSSPSLFSSSSFAAPQRNNKFRCVATTKISIPCTKLAEFHVSPSVSRSERHSAILQIQDSSDLPSALSRHGETLKVQDMNVILRYFGKLSRRQELHQVFDWMQQNQKINFASYSSYVKFMGKSLSSVEGVEMYRSIKDRSTKFNVSVCNAFLSSLTKNGKPESSLKLFTQMKRDGLVPDVVTYSTLLAGCAKVKDGYYKALELVQELMSNGLQMDSVTYGSLLSVCASHKQCNEAAKYFQKMKAEGHSPNVYHYSSLLNAYSADRNYEKAETLIEEMRSAGLVLNKVIYTTLLKVYAKGGLFEKAKELLKELEALGYAKDEIPFCLLMDGLAKSGHLLEAKSVFDEMMGKQVKTDGYSYSIMISAFCRSGLLEDAKKLAFEFEEKYDKYDIVILNAMLSAYCRAGEMENVMSMMKKMDDSAISPDWNTFNILIRYFSKEKLYLLAYRTMEDMHRKGHQPEEGLCSSLIYHLGKTGAYSEAFSVYNMLRYSKRTISKVLHENILHILIAGRLLKDAYVVVKDNAGFISQPAIKKFAVNFLRSGNVNLINDVMKAMHSSGHKIDQVLPQFEKTGFGKLFYSFFGQELFDMAISRYVAKPEKKELLIRLLKWMPGQGYAIDSSTRNLILKNSHLFGHQLIAESLSKQLVMSKIVKPHKENAR
ncbi:pentatricopeptide repeat-containing protein At1g10910, chloroplastic isoform X1 [Lycium ferocissimum]|uniref:pentatricopeptide repeat-containing protein At1g10910, chloroplastic isoform X1 n=1 Tax=Lycium ferocissimum TaxID=112874 RepID=UPI002815F40F|nr:pentatricopeptide repeat-containing protein At1g10910, chloroplastic isoform X1 [Lycium ferocissimum]